MLINSYYCNELIQKSYLSLHLGISDCNKFQRGFWFIFEFRKIIFSVLLVFLQQYQIKSVMQVIINVVFCIYLIYIKPFVRNVTNYMVLALEIMYLFISIVICLLVYINQQSEDQYLIDGLVIIYSSGILKLVFFYIFLFIFQL